MEFVVTYACGGRCKHCSQGEHDSRSARISPSAAADAVREVAKRYPIKTVMCFGGEPLLHTDAVYEIMRAATERSVARRQLITSGYFTTSAERVREVCQKLCECTVNDVLLSVDSFHAEHIPMEWVKRFAVDALDLGLPIRTQPAWLVSRADDNHYNEKTRELLSEFERIGIFQNDGNVIFPEGNALKYLSQYFVGGAPENPYTEDPNNVRCLSFEPDGTVLGSNLYERDIISIMRSYDQNEKN